MITQYWPNVIAMYSRQLSGTSNYFQTPTPFPILASRHDECTS